MKLSWSPKQIALSAPLDAGQVRLQFHARSLRLQAHARTWLMLLACALLSALARALGMGYPGNIVATWAGGCCYARAALYLVRGHCHRLLARRRNEGAEAGDLTLSQ